MNGDGKAINLFNLEIDREIQNAPVKGQCARSYFYGDDLRLERWLQQFEGEYASLVDAIGRADFRLDDASRGVLRRFWLLQHLRTETVSLRTVEMFAQLDEDVGSLPEEYRITIREATQDAIGVFIDDPDRMADLGVCLLRNRTGFPFVTSDNPAVMANRWHFSDKRRRLASPGLDSAGMIGFLPLSPDTLCILYDQSVYSIISTGGLANIDRVDDIEALNIHQVLNCNRNIYFREWSELGVLVGLVARHKADRPPARHLLHHAILDHEENGVQTYRRVSADEARGHQTSMIHYESVTPRPALWPRFLRWRSGGYVFDSGTGQGFARRAHRDRDIAYTKVRI